MFIIKILSYFDLESLFVSWHVVFLLSQEFQSLNEICMDSRFKELLSDLYKDNYSTILLFQGIKF